MRENKNIWWYLFTFWPMALRNGSRWRGWELFGRNFWKHREHIFHDSFGKFFNRYIICKIRGHNNVQWIMDDSKFHCFSCGTSMPGFLDEIEIDAGMVANGERVRIPQGGSIWQPRYDNQIKSLVDGWADPKSDGTGKLTFLSYKS